MAKSSEAQWELPWDNAGYKGLVTSVVYKAPPEKNLESREFQLSWNSEIPLRKIRCKMRGALAFEDKPGMRQDAVKAAGHLVWQY
ncbi:hypothetical protein D3C87_145900 [compost metagenome]